MKYFFLILNIIFFVSCVERFEENEIYGKYSPIGYKNTYDTIEIKANGIYYRKIYNNEKSLVQNINSKWRIENKNQIQFDAFFINLDRDISKFPDLLNDTLNNWGAILETTNNKINFCIGFFDKENCYQKIY